MPKLNFRAKATILLKSVASQACRQGEGGGGGGGGGYQLQTLQRFYLKLHAFQQ